MTPDTNNKLIAGLNLLYGIFQVVIAILTVIWLPGSFKNAPQEFLRLTPLFTAGFTFMALMFAAPSLIAAYALLTRRTWARVAALAAVGMGFLNVGAGTIPSVFTAWFVFSKKARSLYGNDVMFKSSGW